MISTVEAYVGQRLALSEGCTHTMPKPMRLLAVFPDPPWRGGSGSHLRDLEHLHTLVQLGLKPSVLCFVDSAPPPPAPPWVSAGTRLLPFICRPSRAPAGVAAAVARGAGYLSRDLALLRDSSPRFAYPSTYLFDQVDALGQICHLAVETEATAVLLRSWFLPYAKVLKERGLVVVMDAHDAQARAAAQIFRTLPPPRRWLSLPMVLATRRMERRYLRFCDEVWAPSEEDVACMREISPRTRCVVYPNLISMPEIDGDLEDHSRGAGHREEILFVGNMAYPPNARAAEFLVERIVPLLRRQWPNVVTRVVGHAPPDAVARAAQSDPNVVVTGRVPDVSEFYRRAQVVVIPIQTGTGTRVKLLEALSFGKAVVTTPKGVEGIRARDGVHLLIADTGRRVAESIGQLLGDAALRRNLGATGRELVCREYALHVGPRILTAESVLASKGRLWR